ncbi:MAG: LexA family transcriptional regulator [Flavobacterium sp.]|nr:MAG: LexA family transcriptional regulator [Flavobacterium sp.]
MSLFSDNIKFLRDKAKETQQQTADRLEIKRAGYVKYEGGFVEPPYDILRKLALHFNISIDLLLSVDVRKVDVTALLKLENNRLLLPIAVDNQGENVIELVPYKARAGYLSGYADPEFIEGLQHISLPHLKNGKYRAFPVEGDSMPPLRNGDFVIGKYIERLGDVLDGKTYVLLTKNEGMVYKRLNKNGKNGLTATSDNTFYEPYPVKVSDVLEIWQYECCICTSEFEPGEIGPENLAAMFYELKKEIKALRKN